MKVRVAYTIEATDDYRMALNHGWGWHGTLASREDVRAHAERVGSAEDDDIFQEWQDCTEGCHPEPSDD